MRLVSSFVALAVTVSAVSAAFQGFNYGNVFTNGQIKKEADFEAEFRNARNLEGTNGAFNSARLYTMIQGNSGNQPIEAIPAAIKTNTSLLLGLWASAGEATFNNELAALKKAIDQYGNDLAPLIAGISVGSEDLYRISPIGIANGENPGLEPATLVNYIKSVRDLVKGTALEGKKIGHVDTWTAWVDGSNAAVIEACDFLGFDGYPYFQDTMPNHVSNARKLFDESLGATKAAARGKEVWITETGWPVSGKTFGDAVPSRENARKFWTEVGCPMFGSVNVWWYTMQDAAPDTPNPSFGVVGSEMTAKTVYDLSCKDAPKGSNDGEGKGSGNDGGAEDTNDHSGSEGNDGDNSSSSSSNGNDGNDDHSGGSGSDSASGSGSDSNSGASGSGSDSSGGADPGSDSITGSTSDPDSNPKPEPGSKKDAGADGEDDGNNAPSGLTKMNSIGASVVAIVGAIVLL